MALSRIELLLGWLAITLAGAIAVYSYFGGFIAPDSVQSDLTGFGAILLALAIGVTIDGVFDFPPGRILLVLATLALLAVTVVSFIFFLLPSAGLAVGATLLSLFRPHGNRRRQASA